MLKNFRTYQLSVEFYREGQKIKMPCYLREQFNRASSSICLNLAEGSGKRTAADQKKYYRISLGSLRECQSILDLVGDDCLIKLADFLGACLWKICGTS